MNIHGARECFFAVAPHFFEQLRASKGSDLPSPAAVAAEVARLTRDDRVGAIMTQTTEVVSGYRIPDGDAAPAAELVELTAA